LLRLRKLRSLTLRTRVAIDSCPWRGVRAVLRQKARPAADVEAVAAQQRAAGVGQLTGSGRAAQRAERSWDRGGGGRKRGQRGSAMVRRVQSGWLQRMRRLQGGSVAGGSRRAAGGDHATRERCSEMIATGRIQ